MAMLEGELVGEQKVMAARQHWLAEVFDGYLGRRSAQRRKRGCGLANKSLRRQKLTMSKSLAGKSRNLPFSMLKAEIFKPLASQSSLPAKNGQATNPQQHQSKHSRSDSAIPECLPRSAEASEKPQERWLPQTSSRWPWPWAAETQRP